MATPATDKQGNKVRFIRVRGRIVPIKAKGGAGSPAGKKRGSSRNKGAKRGGAAGAAAGGIFAASKLKKSAGVAKAATKLGKFGVGAAIVGTAMAAGGLAGVIGGSLFGGRNEVVAKNRLRRNKSLAKKAAKKATKSKLGFSFVKDKDKGATSVTKG
jgi:hypothetical protein